MFTRDADFVRGFDTLRAALSPYILSSPLLAASSRTTTPIHPGMLLIDTVQGGTVQGDRHTVEGSGRSAGPSAPPEAGNGRAVSNEANQAEAERLIALVDLARGGDSEAFGMLFDHYHPAVYRFVYYRVGSVSQAEDLTSETFFRALRGMASFRWQGKDFGAWLMTIARNLTNDYFKSSRTRLEVTTEDMTPHDSTAEGPEHAVLATLTNEALLSALKQLPADQQECLIMRFLQGMSIAETAAVLGRSEGAVKQLQLRGVRNLAKKLPQDLR